jgi:hypothetical protein
LAKGNGRHAKSAGLVLLTVTLIAGLFGPASAETVLGEAGYYSLTYTVSYRDLPQPGSSVTLVNTLSNSYYANRTVTNPRIVAVEIFSAFGNFSVPGQYPIYFNTGDTLLDQTVQIPGSAALGRYAVTAVAFYQLSYITLQGDVWYDPPPLVIRGTILVTTPLLATMSSILTVLVKYWPPILLIYVTTVVLLTHLVVERDRKKTAAHRSDSVDEF